MAARGGEAGPEVERNPFSFCEFLRSQSRGSQLTSRVPQERLARSRAFAEPFFADPRPGRAWEPQRDASVSSGEDEEEDGEWSASYQPSAEEEDALGARVGSASSPGPAARPARCLPRGDSLPDLSFPLPPPAYGELKEENAKLRSKISQLQILSEAQVDKVRKLEKKLEENKIKEQKEAQDLDAMVQHVEQNLQLMTKRAVKAEKYAAKLKQENAVLQVQLKHYKTENDALKSGQSAGLATVKQNAEVALQNLLTVITNSQSSIKQLVSGAESLQLVAELLKSIDRISEISEDGP
ncbi:PREDICTED: serologically defined colon cancer antigen 3 [Crocodylus porosus]|nr:PREDICTED: serologically defined colon cancer antigen 3 [Crocodylus porosus]